MHVFTVYRTPVFRGQNIESLAEVVDELVWLRPLDPPVLAEGLRRVRQEQRPVRHPVCAVKGPRLKNIYEKRQFRISRLVTEMVIVAAGFKIRNILVCVAKPKEIRLAVIRC